MKSILIPVFSLALAATGCSQEAPKVTPPAAPAPAVAPAAPALVAPESAVPVPAPAAPAPTPAAAAAPAPEAAKPAPDAAAPAPAAAAPAAAPAAVTSETAPATPAPAAVDPAVPAPAAEPAKEGTTPAGAVTKLQLGVIPLVMKYDKPTLTAKAGAKVMLLFTNAKDPLQHNFVLFNPGKLADYGAMADKMLTDPQGMAKFYIPASADVIAKSSKLIGIGQTDLIQFTVPSTPGDYPYVCTFPAHWRTMNGILKVTP